MKDGNPVFSKMTSVRAFDSDTMTVEGTIHRTAILLTLLGASALWTYGMALQDAMPFMVGGLIGGLILALVTIFSPTSAPFTSPFYALAEGLVLGGISKMADLEYPGIALQAVMGTGGVLAAMLALYRFRVIRVTEKFILGVIAATFGICMIYLTHLILALFGIQLPVVESNSGWGIAFSVAVIVVAALNLTIDFHSIEEGVENGAPKYMEWYGAFGLLVTLVWLYMEVLRLLRKLKD